jgi:short-subunit dehydrogenase
MTTATTQQQLALITGGSSGIGLAIAHELAKKNYSLLLVSNQPAELVQCKTEIETQHKVLCHTFYADLTLPESAQVVFNYTVQQGFVIDILVNNAGMLVFSEAVAAAPEKVNAILQLHVVTPTLLCNLFGSEMKKRNSGYILNVSSISSVMPYPGISVYGPSKTYMRYFTRALRSEMKLHGVNVTCLIPGATATALYDTNKVDVSLAMKLGIMHTPQFVAAKAVKAMFHNQPTCIPGILNKIVVRLFPFIPSSLIIFIHKKTNLLDVGKKALG